jgi:hypothetical protein
MRLFAWLVLLTIPGGSVLAQPGAEADLNSRWYLAAKAGHYDEASLWRNFSLRECRAMDPEAPLAPQSALALLEACSFTTQFYLPDRAWVALVAGDLEKAETYARELLRDAPKFRPWERGGRFVYYGYEVLGRILLRKGDVAGAKECLLASGLTTGDPSLNSFGPNLLLAWELLQAGERDTVLQFLDECAQGFWKFNAVQIKVWQDVLRQGKLPDFGYMNLTM